MWKTASGNDRPAKRLVEGFDACHFWNVGLEVALDADLEGDHAAGAAHACAMEANLDNTIAGDIDQFDIPAVRLHGGADEFDDASDAIKDGGCEWPCGGGHRGSVGGGDSMGRRDGTMRA